MKIGLIDLGEMGLHVGQNVMDQKHEIVVYDLHAHEIEGLCTLPVKENGQ